MKINISISSIFLLIMLASVLILLSCKGKKTARIITDKVVTCSVDSIGWRTPQWDSHPSDDVRLIDIKYLNDTIFLFSLVNRNDSIVILSYYWDDHFCFMEERKLNITASESEDDEIRSIAAISYDTILIQKYRSIELYNIPTNTVYHSFHVGANEVLTAIFSPVQYCSKKKSVYSEYINYDKIRKSTNQSSLFCEISIDKKQLVGLPFYEPEGGKFQSLYAKAHSVLTKNDFVVKYNFTNEFEVLDRLRKKESRIQIMIPESIKSELPNSNEEDPDFSMSFLKSNALQLGLTYNREQDKTILIYSMPVAMRNKGSHMPRLSDKPLWIISFDSELQPTEKFIINQPGFWATMFFSAGDKIFLISNRNIYTIST